MIRRVEKGQERGGAEKKTERLLRAFTIFNLVDCLEELREQGYFYVKEWICVGEEGALWSESTAEFPELTDEWRKQQELRPITAIRMLFEQFLTGETKYLYVRREKLAYDEGVVMWISDCVGDWYDNDQTDIWIMDKPPILKGILQEVGIIPESGVFQKISVKSLQELTNDSLFALLYRLKFWQLREGWGKVKEDRHGEDSVAWAGEFMGRGRSEWKDNYLYLVMIKREYEEWELDCCDKMTCYWRESMMDIYVALSQEPMDSVCVGDEKPIQLTEIVGGEEIRAYLNSFTKVDCILKTYDDTNKDV